MIQEVGGYGSRCYSYRHVAPLDRMAASVPVLMDGVNEASERRKISMMDQDDSLNIVGSQMFR